MERRSAVVLDCTQGRVRLRYSARCSSCGGCAGRCQVFVEDADATVELPDAGLDLVRGQAVELLLPEPLLLKQALWGYGLPLLGLLVGAAVLSPLGNAAAAIGAVLGISLAVAYSRRAVARLPTPQIHLASEPTA
jgi:positive regulator of sigma E activity